MLWETMICLHISNHIQRIFLKKVFHVNCRKPLSYSTLFSLVCLFHACGFKYLYSVGSHIFVYKPEFSWIHISSFWLGPSVSLRQQTELMFSLPAQPCCVPCFSEWHYCPPGRSSQKPGNQSSLDLSLPIGPHVLPFYFLTVSQLWTLLSLPLLLPWFGPW